MNVADALASAVEHHQCGRLAEAEALYRQILRQRPNHVGALRLLGIVATQTGHAQAGIELLDRAAAIDPESELTAAALASAHAAAADALHGAGQTPRAIGHYQRAIQLQPDAPEVHNNFSDALRVLGRFEEAAAAAERAIALRPDYAEAHNNLGTALLHLGRREDALTAFDRAIACKAELFQAHANRGNALRALGRDDEALKSYHEAVRLSPQSAQAMSNLANALRDADRLEEAMTFYRAAVAADPNLAAAHTNLGNALRDAGEIESAIGEYREAVRLRPDANVLWSNLLYALQFDPAMSGAQILEEHLRWAKRFPPPATSAPPPSARSKRLRIGYVSPDLRQHPVGRFMEPLLANHDRGAFEIVCYAELARADDLSERLRAHVDVWRETIAMSDEQLAEQIRADGIDILVDLAVHSAGNRLAVFARRPAPVQVTYLGYPGTSGLSAMEFRLTDRFLDPPGEPRPFYSERSVHLATTYWCYAEPSAAPLVSTAPLERNGFVTFGCLNVFGKVSRPALETWRELLDCVPDSRLLVHASAGAHLNRARELFGERVEFIGRVPIDQYFDAYNGIDIALDPFPCGGGTTTYDALWMGVPVVTLAGDIAARRTGASILSLVGLEDLVTSNVRNYITVARDLAADRTRLIELRATLRQRMRASPLMDAAAFVRDLERCYREMWQSCVGAQPTGR